MNVRLFTWIMILFLEFDIFCSAPIELKSEKCECGLTEDYESEYGSYYSGLVHGQVVDPPNKYPWMVSVIREEYRICGGVIISDYYIMTAAHCIVKNNCCNSSCDTPISMSECYASPDDVQIAFIYDDFNYQTHNYAESVHAHPKYAWHTAEYDIALLRMKDAISCSKFSKPLCLPTMPNLDRTGTVGTVAGWGQKQGNEEELEKVLRESRLEIQDDTNCGTPEELTITHFCTLGNGYNPCQGDSGGPLFTESEGRNYIVGILSFGTEPNCSPTSRDFFTRVSPLLSWINETAGLHL